MNRKSDVFASRPPIPLVMLDSSSIMLNSDDPPSPLAVEDHRDTAATCDSACCSLTGSPHSFSSVSIRLGTGGSREATESMSGAAQAKLLAPS